MERTGDNCWDEVTSILTGELVIGVPTTFVSENHGYVEPIFLQVAAMQSRMRHAFGWHIPTQRSSDESNRHGTVER